MASVQELIDAVNAEKSPLIRLLEGAAGGFAQGQNSMYDNTLKIISAQKQRQEMEYQKQFEQEYKAQEAEKERALKSGLNAVGGSPKPAMPGLRMQREIVRGAKGFEVVEPKVTSEIPSSVMPYVQSGDLEGLTQAYGGNVPIEVARLATANRSQTGVQSRFEASQAASKEASVTRKTERVQDKFLNESKGFKDVAESYQRVVASSENPSPAGDLALIFNYMKTLDPGSTVREGEFATAAQSGAFGDRIQTAVQKITSGERLSDDMRADFVNRARMLYESQKALQDQREGEFRRTGAAMGANVDQAIMKIAAPGTKNRLTQKIRVSNGNETLEIDPSDEADAAKEGYRRIQ